MKKLIDRHVELAFFEKEYQRDASSLVILYGRQRVGKTALINKFIENKQAIYFLATEENEIQNRTAFQNIVAEQTGNELLMNVRADSWDMIFKAWVDADGTSGEKRIMIIDEFQYIGKANQAFSSVFQKIWDTILRDRNVMVVLCGSLVPMMENQTLAYSSPLYGRKTGQIRLKQVAFRHYQEFFSDKSEKELIEYYAVTGGVPKYIELFYDSPDIYTAIEKNVLSGSGFLHDEPIFLLQHEVSEIGSYVSIIKTIASGNQKLSKMAAALALKQTGFTKYLKTLIDLDILEREVPVTESNSQKSKKGLYKIKDNFMAFWFKFVFPNLHYIESGHAELAMQKIQKNFVDAHVACVYKDICREKMWELNVNDTWKFHFDRVGRWWNNNTEIDIVALNQEENQVIFGECKYRTDKVGVEVLRNLEQKTEQVEWKREIRKVSYILFSWSGFSEELTELAKTRDDLILML